MHMHHSDCIVCVLHVRADFLPSPGQWEKSEPEAVHGGADFILGERQLVFHREIIKSAVVKTKVVETFGYPI